MKTLPAILGLVFSINQSTAAEDIFNSADLAESLNPIEEQSILSSEAPQFLVEDVGLTQPDSFFGMPPEKNQVFEFTEQQRLLELSNELAVMLRQIKQQGNEQVVLALIESITAETAHFFINAFDSIELESLRASPSPLVAQPEAAESVTELPPPPVVIHDIVPVFAQIESERGGTDKAIVAIDGRRFIRIPGETIAVDGRTILLESITQARVDDRVVYTIWVVENGLRNSLTWK